jgi:hypothetical protein
MLYRHVGSTIKLGKRIMERERMLSSGRSRTKWRCSGRCKARTSSVKRLWKNSRRRYRAKRPTSGLQEWRKSAKRRELRMDWPTSTPRSG